MICMLFKSRNGVHAIVLKFHLCKQTYIILIALSSYKARRQKFSTKVPLIAILINILVKYRFVCVYVLPLVPMENALSIKALTTSDPPTI